MMAIGHRSSTRSTGWCNLTSGPLCGCTGGNGLVSDGPELLCAEWKERHEPVPVNDLDRGFAEAEAALLQHRRPPSLHLDHRGQVTDVGLKLQELVPDLQTVVRFQGSLRQNSLKQDPGVVVFIEM